VIKTADSARSCFGVADFPSIQSRLNPLKPCWSIIESSRMSKNQGLQNRRQVRLYLVMAVSSNKMFELADNNNLYLEACKAQSSIGLWRTLETLRGWIVEKGSKNGVRRNIPRTWGFVSTCLVAGKPEFNPSLAILPLKPPSISNSSYL
jgi:hypothetical protein